MYTSALLFLELACEYSDLRITSLEDQAAPTEDERTARDLLYAVYENVDEPDGFYGIPVVDASQSLLRQYQHEGQALSTFGLQGARYEGTSTIASQTTLSVVEAVSTFGLNRLALALLEPSRSHGSIREADVPADLPFHLSWRSGSWSIPADERLDRSSAASIYAALRGAYRERDAGRWSASVSAGFAVELRKLVAVDMNSPVADAKALDALLSLREVSQWQARLSAGSGDAAAALASVESDMGDEIRCA